MILLEYHFDDLENPGRTTKPANQSTG